MRILIIGGDGMLGHRLLRMLSSRHEVIATVRRRLEHYAGDSLFTGSKTVGGIDVREPGIVNGVVRDLQPHAVINAAGIVKQRGEAADAVASIEVNSLFPHQLAQICKKAGAYLVHYSTDCVFSGRRGSYTEADTPDPIDLYGRSKLLGEVAEPGCITLRTSMIGFELGRRHGLLEWFLSQKGTVPGYRRALFSGLTTSEHARIVQRLLEKNPRLSGIYHVSGQSIAKYDLLRIIAREFHLNTDIEANDTVVIDRTLDSKRFREHLGYQPPSWDVMVAELASQREEGR